MPLEESLDFRNLPCRLSEPSPAVWQPLVLRVLPSIVVSTQWYDVQEEQTETIPLTVSKHP